MNEPQQTEVDLAALQRIQAQVVASLCLEVAQWETVATQAAGQLDELSGRVASQSAELTRLRALLESHGIEDTEPDQAALYAGVGRGVTNGEQP